MAWLGPVKSHVRSAAELIRKQFGISNIGGFASSGHVPGSYHYKGQALDVMIAPSLRPRQGDAVNAWAKANAAQLGVVETIWNREYWTPSGGVERYTGANAHTDHVHISFNATGGSGALGGEVQAASNASDLAGCVLPTTMIGLALLVLRKGLR